MCDTFFKWNADHLAVFAKNSDRSANEPNLTLFVPHRHRSEKTVRCTYISIEQAEEINAVVLVKPSWMWGAEIGINEHGVCIGNEAVFTTSRGKKNEGLIGMDFLRLALERGNSARESLEVILALLGTYGQSGNCGFDKQFFYDNSYIICDRAEALVLETSGKEWAVRQVRDHASISNRLTIGTDCDESSRTARNFRKKFSEPVFSFFSMAKQRKACNDAILRNSSSLAAGEVLAALRSHTADDDHLFRKGSMSSVCMHSGGLADQTTGSMAVINRAGLPAIWISGCSSPCLSIFKPTYFGQSIAPVFIDERQSFDYWLKREYLHRAIYAGLVDVKKYRADIAVIENRFIAGEEALIRSKAPMEAFYEFSRRCSAEEQEFVDSFDGVIARIKNDPALLPKTWRKKASSLGKNVFELNQGFHR